ncbi:MAG TPA: beta-L-arabinofuranosidase domain-containing protein [Clostridia bacterium]|nr:beta-L-arabinofuranosidase domain-containing protein [Clostridia bacterium]
MGILYNSEHKENVRAKGPELRNVNITDGFWKKYADLVLDTVIPYQWEALNDRIPEAEPSYAVRNFRIAAGEAEGAFGGLVFQDSDVAKWLEAVGYSLAIRPDPELEKAADRMIDIIGRAQQPDGYLNTYFTVKEPGKRWTNLLECHELYCAGHMMEAAVAYYEGTGKRKLLDIMCRYADHIDSVFGTEPGKLRGYDGHEEVELALYKLYKATENDRYLKLASYFIDERGQNPSFFIQEWEKRGGISHWHKCVTPKPDLSYNQAHEPVREQKDAVGHAVRSVYLYSAMADIAAETGDEELKAACRTLWDSITKKRMYITGGIGSTYHGEAFSFDYDLPNDTAYQETCASIGLVFFARRMLKMEPHGEYADIMERALFNSVLSGMGQEGRSFFYVNPLEVLPEACCKDPGKHHVKPVRQKWYGCACCPPNLSRLLASLGGYIYTSTEDTIYVNLYMGNTAQVGICGGEAEISQETSYPWDGKVAFTLGKVPDCEFTLALRIPRWCSEASLYVNGEKAGYGCETANGYAKLKRCWKAGDRIVLDLPMEPVLISANPNVRENAGKAAIQRGPLVYCLEEADNGKALAGIRIDPAKNLECRFEPDFLGGAAVIEGTAFRTLQSGWENKLYRPLAPEEERETRFTAIPYYLWANRGQGEMLVWCRLKE